MAKIVSKGSILQLSIATVYTAVSQLTALSKGEMTPETFDSRTLDQADAGVTNDVTGYVDPSDMTGEMFFDPALTIHKALLTRITTPVVAEWKLIFSNATEWTFMGVVGLGVAIAMSDGVKSSFSIKLSGLPTFPA